MWASVGVGSQSALSASAGASEKTTQQVQGILEVVWAGAIQPLVMGLAGASIHFGSLPTGTALRALALTAIGESPLQCVFQPSFSFDLTCAVLLRSRLKAFRHMQLLSLVRALHQHSACLVAQHSVCTRHADTPIFEAVLSDTVSIVSKPHITDMTKCWTCL